MSFDIASLRAAIAKHGPVARILIAQHAGSAPRETGTSMLVWASGQQGTIGGGALEFEAVKQARAQLSNGKPHLSRIPLGPNLGQCCGGAVTLVTEMFDDATLADLNTETTYLRRITGDAEAPLALRRFTTNARNSGTLPETTLQDGWLVEPITTTAPPLWIYGAGHVGRALVNTLSPLPDFDITWVDTATDRYPDQIPYNVTQLPAANPAEAAKLAPRDAHHLILTYSHALDLELCHRLLTKGFASAGLIGSATKWARFRKQLAQLGHSPDAIARIICPIGQPELGKHPQAIAIGVASALLTEARRRSIPNDSGTARGDIAL